MTNDTNFVKPTINPRGKATMARPIGIPTIQVIPRQSKETKRKHEAKTNTITGNQTINFLKPELII